MTWIKWCTDLGCAVKRDSLRRQWVFSRVSARELNKIWGMFLKCQSMFQMTAEVFSRLHLDPLIAIYVSVSPKSSLLAPPLQESPPCSSSSPIRYLCIIIICTLERSATPRGQSSHSHTCWTLCAELSWTANEAKRGTPSGEANRRLGTCSSSMTHRQRLREMSQCHF